MNELIELLLGIIGIATVLSLLVWLTSTKRRRVKSSAMPITQPAIEDKSRSHVVSKDASIQQAMEMLDKLEEFTLKPFQDFQERSQERTSERAELRQKYETEFDDWEEFEDCVVKRLDEAMSDPNLAQKVEESLKLDPTPPDALFYFAADDILFNFGLTLMPGVETAGLDAYDQWVNDLLRKEYERKSAKHESRQLVVSSIEEGQTSNPNGEIIKLIEEIARLRDNGILSEEEFQTKKAELLKRL